MRLGDLLTQTFNQREFILLHSLDVAGAETDLEPHFKASWKLAEKATICSKLLNKVFTSSADMMMTFDAPLYISSTTFISWPKECSVSTSSLMICRRLTTFHFWWNLTGKNDDIRRASVYIIDDPHILAERMLSVHEIFNDMSSFDDFSSQRQPGWQKRSQMMIEESARRWTIYEGINLCG